MLPFFNVISFRVVSGGVTVFPVYFLSLLIVFLFSVMEGVILPLSDFVMNELVNNNYLSTDHMSKFNEIYSVVLIVTKLRVTTWLSIKLTKKYVNLRKGNTITK